MTPEQYTKIITDPEFAKRELQSSLESLLQEQLKAPTLPSPEKICDAIIDALARDIPREFLQPEAIDITADPDDPRTLHVNVTLPGQIHEMQYDEPQQPLRTNHVSVDPCPECHGTGWLPLFSSVSRCSRGCR